MKGKTQEDGRERQRKCSSHFLSAEDETDKKSGLCYRESQGQAGVESSMSGRLRAVSTRDRCCLMWIVTEIV
jgi:hypothetical protein